jgi:peptidoglycan/LPS O-acetylase OafA/YrhL
MCAEEQLYVLIPILCFIAFKWRLPVLMGLFVVAPVSRWFVSEHLPYPAVWNFTTSHLDVFAIGVLLASLDYAKGPRWQRVRAAIADCWWVALAAGALTLVLVMSAAIDPQWVFGSAAATWTYLTAALLWAWMLVKLTQRPQTQVMPATRRAVWMGQRSYGIYVYHRPVAHFGVWVVSAVVIPAPVIGVILLAVVLGFSEFSFRWIESPFLRLKARFSRDPTPSS